MAAGWRVRAWIQAWSGAGGDGGGVSSGSQRSGCVVQPGKIPTNSLDAIDWVILSLRRIWRGADIFRRQAIRARSFGTEVPQDDAQMVCGGETCMGPSLHAGRRF